MATSVQRIQVGDLQVVSELHDFINNDVLPGLDVEPDRFWSGFAEIIHKFSPRNAELLAKRDALQAQIDAWHKANPGRPNPEAYKAFLTEIGYLVPEGEAFKVSTSNVDPEIATIAGPQLVVPVSNARFAANAANARWGSLYDALYGTDTIDGAAPPPGPYDSARGAKVIDFARARLDEFVPLAKGSHKDAVSYTVHEGQLLVSLRDYSSTGLAQPEKFVGYCGPEHNASAILLQNNGLHLEIQIDREDSVGKTDDAGVKGVLLESAITTIMDLEDSVSTVDSPDKVAAYRNWLGLMKGDLIGDFERAGKTVTRRLNPDRDYVAPDGTSLSLAGRSLMLIRNVGHLTSDDSILDPNGSVPEGIIDAVVTSLIALHDLNHAGNFVNSAAGSIYIVKPKMHGPEEVAHACEILNATEDLLRLPRNTIKIGIMDEERRTTANLKESIRVAQERIMFINTGFLDRTGDEIHTSMQAGPMLPNVDMQKAHWKRSYEDWNVETGLDCGLPGHAQIGKGMWARPNDMAAMLKEKIGHPQSGATTAWVPSPTAATLHALHYHMVSVAARQDELRAKLETGNRATIDDILTVPLFDPTETTPEQIQREIDSSAQSILGYVARWVGQGVGCSTVPDIDGVGLMEDQATLRIHSQKLANWILHGVCTQEQVEDALHRMAEVVDQQNANDDAYTSMAGGNWGSPEFQAARELIFKGVESPNGYTAPILNRWRRMVKTAKTALAT